MSFLPYAISALVILFLFFYLFWRIKFKTKLTQSIQILTYHRINDDFDWGITRQKVGQFEKGMKFLHDLGYKSVTLEEVFRSQEVFDRKVVITFDDGYEDIYSNAFPILQEYNFTAFVFLITGFVGKHNSWDYNLGRRRKKHLNWKQIKEMCNHGFGFGSHTVNHPDLTRIDQRFVEYELEKSKEVLEDKLGKEVSFLSYPFGRYNRFVQEAAERSGYKRAYTLCSKNREDGFQSRQRRDFQPFAQERWGIYLFDSPLTLRIKLNHNPATGGIFNRLFWIEDLKGRIINRFASGTAILKGSPDYSSMIPNR